MKISYYPTRTMHFTINPCRFAPKRTVSPLAPPGFVRWSERVRRPHPDKNCVFRQQTRRCEPKLQILRLKILRAAWAYLEIFVRDWRRQPYLKCHWNHLTDAQAIVQVRPPQTYYDPTKRWAAWCSRAQEVFPQWIEWERNERALARDRALKRAVREKENLAALEKASPVCLVPGKVAIPSEASGSTKETSAQVGTLVRRQPESKLQPVGSSSPEGRSKDVSTREDIRPQNLVRGSGQNEAPSPGSSGIPGAAGRPKSRRLFSTPRTTALPKVDTPVCRQPESELEPVGSSSPAGPSKDVPTREDIRPQNPVLGSGQDEAPSPGTSASVDVASRPKSRRLFSTTRRTAPSMVMQVSETSTLVGTDKDVCEKPTLDETRKANSIGGGGDSLGSAAPTGDVEAERQPEAKEPELAPEKANPVAPKQKRRNTARKKANSATSSATENSEGGKAAAPATPVLRRSTRRRRPPQRLSF
ncbi:hypothetical protein BDZ88DRAFT_174617 [Geranomyces variabilis]|nr:hypothetical protein BDZ88DRAFT_174617 [Geranomyces variabilis]